MLLKRLEFIDVSLGEKPYLTGSDFTVADAYLYVTLSWHRRVGVDLSNLPGLRPSMSAPASALPCRPRAGLRGSQPRKSVLHQPPATASLPTRGPAPAPALSRINRNNSGRRDTQCSGARGDTAVTLAAPAKASLPPHVPAGSHRRQPLQGGRSDRAAADLPGACVIKTCLREVQVTTREALDVGALPAATADAGALYWGADAYGFLLRLASGLESEIAGETEIFGQIKQAWRDYETDRSAERASPPTLDAAPIAGDQGNSQRIHRWPRQRDLWFAGAATAGRPAGRHDPAGWCRPARRLRYCRIWTALTCASTTAVRHARWRCSLPRVSATAATGPLCSSRRWRQNWRSGGKRAMSYSASRRTPSGMPPAPPPGVNTPPPVAVASCIWALWALSARPGRMRRGSPRCRNYSGCAMRRPSSATRCWHARDAPAWERRSWQAR